MDIIIENGTILPMDRAIDSPLCFIGDIGIESNRIVMVSTNKRHTDMFVQQHPSCQRIDASGCVVMPGLINTHTHIAMSLLRGISDDVPLMEWLNNHIWPVEAKMNYDSVLIGARLGAIEMLKGGTTSFVDMYPYQEAVAEGSVQTGIRAFLSPCAMDFRMEHYLKDVEALERRFKNNPLITILTGIHALYTCSEENIKRCIDSSTKENSIIHIHNAETLDEIATVKEKYNTTPSEYLKRVGVLQRPTIAAHCVHMTDNDIEIFSKHHVSVAYNPQSNMKLASGIAPVAKMLERGINVSIGTDGAASNNDLDMWEEMRTASLLQKVFTRNPCALPAYQVLQMATRHGAKAIGREGELGIIAEGALADVIIVDFNTPHLYPHTNIISELVYSCHASDVATVIVNGNIVVRDRVCQTVCEKDVCNSAEQHIKQLL